ncbi:MAG: peptidyl-prolyl cis-trans isomerase [Deltaproteobacteria bacterium]|nr:peptidyl-prolyl cis-trans isomerase [Deltaproteobacteria bacterium]
MMTCRSYRLLFLVFMPLASCAPKPLSEDAMAGRGGSGDAVLAVVSGRDIRMGHFLVEQTLAHALVAGRFRSEVKQVDLVASIADREVLFSEGWKSEAMRVRPEVRAAVVRALARELVAAEVARSGAGEVVEDRELRAAFDARKNEWREPLRVRIRTILRLWTPMDLAARRDEQRALLARLRGEIAAGKSFAAVAKEHNEDPENRAEGGDVGWYDVGSEFIPEGARALRAVGDLSPVVEVGNGFRLFAVTETAESHTLPFESARETIRRDIIFNRVRDRLAATLRAKR